MARDFVEYACACHVGKVRKLNQDNILCGNVYLDAYKNDEAYTQSGRISISENPKFCIFDGMGGMEKGEIASYLAAKCAKETENGKDAVSTVKKICQSANDAINEYAEKYIVSEMGTTAAIIILTKDRIVACNVGDSKIFSYRDKRLVQISLDHTSSARAGTKPFLYQYLGMPSEETIIEPYIIEKDYCENDIYLLCSDGLTDMVGLDEIADVISQNKVDDICTTLLMKALEAGGRDNITIIICRVVRKRGLFH